jgi:sugar fermentation stimulation protein A
MKYKGYKMPPLTGGRLVKRYKRFLADIELETGEKVTAHCPNSGSMKGCAVPGSRVWLSQNDNPKRKYKYTWELAKVPGTMIGINTLVPNRLVKQSIENGLIDSLAGYEHVKAEVKTSSHTRLDLLLETKTHQKCYVEIKNCTMVEDGVAMFPDAVTTRGQKHLDELSFLVSKGHRGVIFFLIQRTDAKVFKPAEHIDKIYAQKLREAVKNGVEVIAMDTTINTEIISIKNAVPVHLY